VEWRLDFLHQLFGKSFLKRKFQKAFENLKSLDHFVHETGYFGGAWNGRK
jgi:hypothetical protein